MAKINKLFLFFATSIVFLGLVKISYAKICCCPPADNPSGPHTNLTTYDGDAACIAQKCTPKDGTQCTDTATSGPTLKDPLGINGNSQGVQIIIGRVIRAILGLVGSIALLMFVYGGFLWMTAAGNEEKVTKGKEIFVWATIGLAVIFSAYILVHYLLTSILKVS